MRMGPIQLGSTIMKIYEQYPPVLQDFTGLVFTDEDRVPLYWVDNETVLGVHTRNSLIKFYESFNPSWLDMRVKWEHHDGHASGKFLFEHTIGDVLDMYEADIGDHSTYFDTVGWWVWYDNFAIRRLI